MQSAAPTAAFAATIVHFRAGLMSLA